jgi:cytochrome c556
LKLRGAASNSQLEGGDKACRIRRNSMKKMLIVAALVVASAGAAFAQANVITQRRDILKTFGPVSRDLGQMLRGEAAFDAAKVKAGLAVLRDGAPKLPALFPDGSFTGDTKALPVIATDRAAFSAIFAKMAADATAADATITNEATFKTEMPKVFGNCGACHNTYRGR